MRQFCHMEINGLDCFSGSSESIRLLSCCPPAPQQEGQKEEGRKNRQRYQKCNSVCEEHCKNPLKDAIYPGTVTSFGDEDNF